MPESDADADAYVVAIPSYRRAELLRDKTLRMLSKGGVPPERIHVFVANKTEAAAYAAAIPRELYGRIVVGKRGITPQRRFIARHFAEGTAIVSVDDDVASLHRRVSATELSPPIADVHGFFARAFAECRREGLYLWGVYPVLNAFYMKPGVTHDLKFVLGTLYGFINRRDRALMPTLGEKEDIEMSIRYYLKDGGVVRFNDVALKTRFHNPNGGLGDVAGRFDVNERAAAALKARYPDLGFVWHRKSGMAEFRLARRPRVTPPPPSARG